MLAFILAFVSLLSWGQTSHSFKNVAIASGYMCGYVDDSVNCWGKNESGQALSLDGFSNIRQVTLTERHGCLLDDIGMSCWGDKTPELNPEMTFGGSSISMFDTSALSTCAVINSKIHCTGFLAKTFDQVGVVEKISIMGTAGCWLNNGEIGCLTAREASNSIVTKLPKDLGHVLDISVSNEAACILNKQAQLICWGYQHDGLPKQLSFIPKAVFTTPYDACVLGKTGEVECVFEPVKLPEGFGPVISMTSNRENMSFCALNEKNAFYCWGSYLTDKYPPTVSDIFMMTAYERGTVFVTRDGAIITSGYENKSPFRAAQNISYLEGRYGLVCFVDDFGGHCFGRDYGGVVEVPHEIEEFKAITPSDESACAIIGEGKVRCWGKGSAGVANPPRGLKGVEKLVSGFNYFCSLTDLNQIICWGRIAPVPTFPEGLKVLDISGGDYYACALLNDQSVSCWGTRMTGDAPTNLEGVTGLIAGSEFTCAYGATHIQCWGDAEFNKLLPPKVAGVIHKISAGREHGCLQDDEKIKCWGKNMNGEYQFFQE